MIKPTISQAREILEKFSVSSGVKTVLPLYTELFADVKTPTEVLRAVKKGRKTGSKAVLLESAAAGENWGRYSYIAFDPSMEITVQNGCVTVRESGGEVTYSASDVHETVSKIINSRKSPHVPGLPDFTGGFAGYFSYEYFVYLEDGIKFPELDPFGFDDCRLMMFDRVIAFDSLLQKIILIVNIDASDLDKGYEYAAETLKQMTETVLSNLPPASASVSKPSKKLDFLASVTKEEYLKSVLKIKHHIKEGDIFQCVPSIRFTAPYEDGDFFNAYRCLRTVSPSAYMFYADFSDLTLMGASPETLVSLKCGILHSFPSSGNCRCGHTEEETAAEKLLQDENILAEHDILVDSCRNDFGKISEFCSVKVYDYRKIKHLTDICCITSSISAEILSDKTAADAIAAFFPALSGIPKKRAFEITGHIENGVKRGTYSGGIGYIGFSGNMDLCVGTGMAVLKNSKAVIQAGAAVTAYSVPEEKYAETESSATAIMNALNLAEEL